MPLTPRQSRFVSEYLTTLNATQAAKNAGYTGSDATLGVTGHDLLKNPNVAQAVAAAFAEHSALSQMNADRTLQLIADHANASLDDFFDVDGDGAAYLNLAKAKALGKMHLLRKLSYDRQGNAVIELHNVQGALTLLARHHGLLNDRVTHDITSLSDQELLARRTVVGAAIDASAEGVAGRGAQAERGTGASGPDSPA